MSETQPIIAQLNPFLQQAWEKAGFEAMTSVQSTTIPLIIEGKDVAAESPTGTGKTLAYLLPVLNKIDAKMQNTQAVILASSQELVMQILAEIQKWGEGSGIKSASLIGGANLKRQIDKLKKSPHIIVGTPGRTNELIKQKKLKMHKVHTIVLDEGDQLLTPEHNETVKSIVKSTLADQRQLLLFSATLPEAVEKSINRLANDPEIIKVKKDDTIDAAKVEHIYFRSEQRDKIKILEKIARLDGTKSLVFIKDIPNLIIAAEKLNFKDIPVGQLHSELTKQDRQKYLNKFREGNSEMLLVTDIAARGLDIKGVTHAVHFDFPREQDKYIHRSGRTGRFGAEGTVISIVNEREERDLKKFCKALNIEPLLKEFYGGKIVDPE
ncbi:MULTISPECIES: DEAD/DEAH box helicase [unclassified Mesobacillus]|uniref:DEAD/DEAH box helicase n=1 Tax=unclassified Mesobacillus TaxID=2675270 RepID=UPI00203E2B0D|nr:MULTISPECIES: DEAD/DEAH box helicase [unclassified Mesobacillus]MCM3125472.1 DEAD/DEAH box helicase [Mesobacillus sp. MER 33]MCM3234484.1 DEAD/DEAH box helicase [Mesobacillus sp. MER 48]